ncbi:MAG TPA: sulfatase [Actinomycetota bacterium]|nr:sulfatase [Actinomycetota bacterium]
MLAVLTGAALMQGPSFVAHTASPPPALTLSPRPDIVLIITDDQRYDTFQVMPHVQRLLIDGGMQLSQAITSNPLCCPSRATILTGRYSHTTGVYFNSGSHGGWHAFRPSESSTIATALDAVGYRTALFGKYLNGYGGSRVAVPPGWDEWLAFTSGNGYYDYDMFDGRRRHDFGSGPGDYSTDVIAGRAVSFIRGTSAQSPLFMVVAPFAPHNPATPAPRHAGAFSGVPVDFGPAVNERDVSDKPRFARRRLLDLGPLAERQRRRWESLLAVDDMVSRIVTALRDTGRASNTLVIYVSDNGNMVGEHRLRQKMVPYEESIRVPMAVRFPGRVPTGAVSRALVSNVDIAPTILDFAGASLPTEGVSMRRLITGTSSSIRRSVLLEHLRASSHVPTYCGVRKKRYTFVRYGAGEEELYDLLRDPYQLRNVARLRPGKAGNLRSLTRSLCRPRPPTFSWSRRPSPATVDGVQGARPLGIRTRKR